MISTYNLVHEYKDLEKKLKIDCEKQSEKNYEKFFKRCNMLFDEKNDLLLKAAHRKKTWRSEQCDEVSEL